MNEVVDPNSRMADLVGLLYVLDTVFNGRVVDLYELEKEMEVDLDDLMPIVYTASSLGLVSAESGNISMTTAGKEFIHANMRRRKEIIRQSIASLEPFKTAVELQEFEIPALSEALEKKGIQTYNTPSGLHDLELILIEWGIYSGLLKKKGDRFRVAQ
jgi:hypothetical protein